MKLFKLWQESEMLEHFLTEDETIQAMAGK
jgi:hypothetical protein